MDHAEKFGQATMQKIKWRLMPFLFVLYIIAMLDRGNISFAALDMNRALGISAASFGLVAGIFYTGYVIFEVPSNMLMNRFGAKLWIARIMVTWGIVVMLFTWVQNLDQVLVLRVLLGAAEAGFVPGVYLYMTYWFPEKEYARSVAFFTAAIPIGNIITAPLTTWIMDNVHWFSMDGWRWMFFWSAVPAIVFGIITFFYLDNKPGEAKWLTNDEKDWLVAKLDQERLAKERLAKEQTEKLTVWQVLAMPKVWLLGCSFLLLVVGTVGIGRWLPTIVKGYASGLTNTQIGYIVMVPYIISAIIMQFWARHSDRTGERRWHAALASLIGAIGLVVAVNAGTPLIKMVGITLALTGVCCFQGPFWALTKGILSDKSNVVGIAAVATLGNFGGFFGPTVVGYLTQITGNTNAGLVFISASMVGSCLLIATLIKPAKPVANQ